MVNLPQSDLLKQLSNPLNCNSDLSKKCIQQIKQICKQQKKSIKTTRSTSARQTNIRGNLEWTDQQIYEFLYQIVSICYEGLHKSVVNTKSDSSKKLPPFIICWSQVGMLALSQLELRNCLPVLELIDISYRFYFVLLETNPKAFQVGDCEKFQTIIQNYILEVEIDTSDITQKRKLSPSEPVSDITMHPFCFKIEDSSKLNDKLIEMILFFQSLKIQQVVKMSLTGSLLDLKLALDAPGSPYVLFELAIQKSLTKSPTQLAKSYLLLANYIVDNKLLTPQDSHHILQTSMLTYVQSGLQPTSNIFSMLYKFGSYIEEEGLITLNHFQQLLKICKRLKIQLKTSDYFLNWVSILLKLIVKYKNLHTYSSLINWVKDLIHQDNSLNSTHQRLLTIGILTIEGFAFCFEAIQDQKPKCLKLNQLIMTLQDTLPNVMNQYTSKDQSTILSTMSNLMYRLSKIIGQWIKLLPIQHNVINENESNLIVTILKVWTKLLSFISTRFSQNDLKGLIGKQVDSFIGIFCKRVSLDLTVSTHYLNLIQVVCCIADPAKTPTLVNYIQYAGIAAYNSKQFNLASSYFDFGCQIIKNYLNLKLSEKEINQTRTTLNALTTYLSKSRANLGDLDGLKNSYIKNILNEFNSSPQYVQSNLNLTKVDENDSIVKLVDNLVKIHHQSKRFDPKFLKDCLEKELDLDSHQRSLILLILQREIQVTMNICGYPTRYQLGIQLVNQLDEIVNGSDYPLLKSCILLDLIYFELNQFQIEIVDAYSSKASSIKFTNDNSLNQKWMKLLKQVGQLLDQEDYSKDNYHQNLIPLLKCKKIALEYLIELKHRKMEPKDLKRIFNSLDCSEVLPTDHFNKLETYPEDPFVIQYIKLQLIELFQMINGTLTLGSYHDYTIQLSYTLLNMIANSTINNRCELSFRLFLKLSSIYLSKGEINLSEKILIQCQRRIDSPKDIDLESITLFWSIWITHFNMRQINEQCQIGLESIERISQKHSNLTKVELIPVTLPIQLALSHYYLSKGRISSGLELALKSTHSACHLQNIKLSQRSNSKAIHRGNCFDKGLYELCWNVNSFEYFETMIVSLQLLIEAYTNKGSYQLADYMCQQGIDLAEATGIITIKLNFDLLKIDLQSKRHLWKESEVELDQIFTNFSKTASLDQSHQVSSIWKIQAKNQLRKFQFSNSQNSFYHTYRWLTNSNFIMDDSNLSMECEEINTNIPLNKLMAIKDNLPDILPSGRSSTLSNWVWSQLITGLISKKNLFDEYLSLWDNQSDLDFNTSLIRAKSELIQGISILENCSTFSCLMNCFWTLPLSCQITVSSQVNPTNDIHLVVSKSMSHLKIAFDLLTNLIPSCYHSCDVNTVKEILLYLSRLTMMMELLNHQNGTQDHITITSYCLLIGKGIALSRNQLDIVMNPNDSLRPLSQWPNPKDLDTHLPYLESKLSQFQINQTIDNHYQLVQNEPKTFWDDILNYLPKNWAVSSLDYCRESNDLIVTRVDHFGGINVARMPLVQHAIIPNDYRNPAESISGFPYAHAFDELDTIIKRSVQLSKEGVNCVTREDKMNWWHNRKLLDDQLKDLLDRIEQRWLGVFKSFLTHDLNPISDMELDSLCDNINQILFPVFQSKINNQHIQAIDKLNVNRGLIQNFIRLHRDITISDIEDILSLIIDTFNLMLHTEIELSSDEHSSLTDQLHRIFQNAMNSKRDPNRKIDHVILILDNYLQSFPWESLPCMLNRSTSRMPSLVMLRDRLIQLSQPDHPIASQPEVGFHVNSDSTFYMLNPSKDLVRTQHYFADALKDAGWRGAIGHAPDESTLERCVGATALYLYFGHGTGEQYLKGAKVHRMTPAPTAILLGCSSGRIAFQGEFDGFGAPYHYLLGGSPAVVANLWDVTDRDIDKFSHQLLALWGLDTFRKLPTIDDRDVMQDHDPNEKVSLPSAVTRSRSACVLKYLVGAAPVVYGLPVYIK